MHTLKIPTPVIPRCDFCTSLEIHARYDAEDFEAGEFSNGKQTLHVVSTGCWYACRECSELVDRGDWDALADRALASYEARYGTPLKRKAELRKVIRSAYDSFQRLRKMAS